MRVSQLGVLLMEPWSLDVYFSHCFWRLLLLSTLFVRNVLLSYTLKVKLLLFDLLSGQRLVMHAANSILSRLSFKHFWTFIVACWVQVNFISLKFCRKDNGLSNVFSILLWLFIRILFEGKREIVFLSAVWSLKMNNTILLRVLVAFLWDKRLLDVSIRFDGFGLLRLL